MPRKMDDGNVSSKSHQHHPLSRIPAPKTGRYQVKNIENGYERGETGQKTATGNASAKRFETFVMTGDKIIQTTAPHHVPETVKESPTQKRKREIRHSPVLVKRDGRGNIGTPGDSPKVSPKRKPAQRAIIESPKAAPKKVVHSPQTQRKEAESPKGSPKSDHRKSPVRQSRLPRYTPKNSPKLAQKQSQSSAESKHVSGSGKSTEPKDTSTDVAVVLSKNGDSVQQKDTSLISVDTNGALSPVYVKLDKQRHELELLGYPRFPDVPVELDIPPDDISSEDEKFKHEAMVDIDELPPPPEEFFSSEAVIVQEKQEPPSSALCVTSLQTAQELSRPQVTDTKEQRKDDGQAGDVMSEQPVTQDSNSEQNTEPCSDVTGVNQVQDITQLLDTKVKQEMECISDLVMDTVMNMATVAESKSVLDDASRDMEQSGNTTPMHQDLASGDMEPELDKDNAVMASDANDVVARSPTHCSAISPAHHGRSASVSETSAIDSSTNSISSDSKVELHKGSPSRTIVVSKSAEKITPNKASSSSTTNKTISDNLVVRSSKSHENYLERNEVITFVDIDLDENMASSVDALHHEKSSTSLDSLNYVQFHEQSHSVDASPDKHIEKAPGERKLMPTFINLEEARSITKLKEGAKLRDFSKGKGDTVPMSQTSPIKSKKSEEKKTTEALPSHGKGPARDTSGRPPKSPKTTPTKQAKNPASQPTTPVAKTNHITPESCATEDTVDSEETEPDVPIVDSPVKSPSSHVVHTDLPTETEPPIATSSAPPSPSLEDMEQNTEQENDTPHECQEQSGQDSPESEKDFNFYHKPTKEIDRPSAARLAKRLYQLDGFRKTDITIHLCKKNDFSYLVGEEYLKFFDFTGMTLDQALHTFLKNLTLAGETQERERVLAHLSKRYLENNPGSFNSEDACHTLVCALMLLNTDLHGQNIGRKMTVNEFIENLADLNDGENFPKEILKNLYYSIKTDPLECHIDDEQDTEAMASQAQRAGLSQEAQRYIGHNPFLDIPDPSKTTEYKKGYVMRKCCVNADGRKTPMGKRGWKMFFATLRDMVLYLHKDDHAFKKNTMVASTANAIRIHHALAFRATDYKKKQHVFRLQTADWAQYLFQTSNSKECQEWIDTINFVAASLSAPPLPGGCGSQRKFERPLLPASYTRYNLREQAQHHEQRMLQVEQELHDHRKHPPEKGAKSRYIQDYMEKEAYLQFELKRFKVYSALLQMKLATFPELEPSLVEVAIGEVDETNSSPSSPEQPRVIPLEADLAAERNQATSAALSGQHRSGKPVQRSLSDRLPLEKRSAPPRDQMVLAKLQKSPTCKTSPNLATSPSQPPNQTTFITTQPNVLCSSHTYETQV